MAKSFHQYSPRAQVLTCARGIRRGGSAALDLCHVGEGRIDAYWELALKPWDLGAVILVAREAGARVEDFIGNDDPRYTRRILASAPGVFDAMIEAIACAHQSPDLDVLGPHPGTALSMTGALPGEEPS